ncbi:MAG: VWA domain-containing protein, partial [bacterium]|nr:VWA domain-containing protein [bacterium]
MPEDNLVSHKEAIRLVQSGMKENDLVEVTAFARNTALENRPGRGEFPGFVNDVGDDQSNLAQALQRALSLIPQGSPGRILVLSDGKWTGTDPMKAGTYAARRSVAIDYRMYRRHQANDISIEELITPEATTPGESFIIKARVNSPSSQEIEYTLFRDNTVISKGIKEFSPGKQTLLFRDKATGPGTYQYSLRIKGREKDPVPENNKARTIM